MINADQLECLADIFSNTDSVEDIDIKLDPVSRSITVHYEDLDDEWFKEITAAAGKKLIYIEGVPTLVDYLFIDEIEIKEVIDKRIADLISGRIGVNDET